jgi:hypothetical protein
MNLILVYDLLNVYLNSILKHFIEDFSLMFIRILVYGVCVCVCVCVSSSSFGIRVILALQNKFGGIYSYFME